MKFYAFRIRKSPHYLFKSFYSTISISKVSIIYLVDTFKSGVRPFRLEFIIQGNDAKNVINPEIPSELFLPLIQFSMILWSKESNFPPMRC